MSDQEEALRAQNILKSIHTLDEQALISLRKEYSPFAGDIPTAPPAYQLQHQVYNRSSELLREMDQNRQKIVSATKAETDKKWDFWSSHLVQIIGAILSGLIIWWLTT